MENFYIFGFYFYFACKFSRLDDDNKRRSKEKKNNWARISLQKNPKKFDGLFMFHILNLYVEFFDA